MSVKIMSLVWQNATDLKGHELLVMLALADWSNDEGRSWPGIAAIAKKARISERTARYVLQRLTEIGYVAVEEHRGRGHTNEYLLNLQVLGLEKVQPLQVLEPENLQSTTQNLQNPSLKPAKSPAYQAQHPSIDTLIDTSVKKRGKPPQPTPTSFPEGFEVTDAMYAKVRSKYPGLDIDDATEEWEASMRSGRHKYQYTDWVSAWYNAMKRAARWSKEQGSKTNGQPTSNKAAAAALRNFERIAARRAARSVGDVDNDYLLDEGPGRA